MPVDADNCTLDKKSNALSSLELPAEKHHFVLDRGRCDLCPLVICVSGAKKTEGACLGRSQGGGGCKKIKKALKPSESSYHYSR